MRISKSEITKDFIPFLYDVSIFISIAVLTKGLRYIGSVLAARYLGVIEYGQLVLFMQSAGYVSVVLELGLPSAIIFFCVRRNERLGPLVILSLLSITGIAVAMLIGAWVTPTVLIDKYLLETMANELLWIMFYGIIIASSNILLAGIRAQKRNSLFSILFALPGALFFMLLVSAISFGVLGFELALMFLVLSSLFSLLTLLISLRFDLTGEITLRVASLRSVFGYGLRNYLTRILSAGFQIIPIMFIAAATYEEALGYFGAAIVAASLFRLVGQSLSLFLTAQISDKQKYESFRFTILLSIFLGLGLALIIPVVLYFSDFLISFIYGDAYLGAVTIIQWMVGAVTCEILIGILLRPFITSEKPIHSVQWFVYGLILIVLLANLAMVESTTVSFYLNEVGKALLISQSVGLVMALLLLLTWSKHDLRSTL